MGGDRCAIELVHALKKKPPLTTLSFPAVQLYDFLPEDDNPVVNSGRVMMAFLSHVEFFVLCRELFDWGFPFLMLAGFI